MVFGWLSLLPVVWWGGLVGPLPPPGATLRAEGTVSAKAPWRAAVAPNRRGWLFLELGSDAPLPRVDLDLQVGQRLTAASHLARERLLVPITRPPHPVSVVVRSDKRARFNLGVTQLVSAGTLASGSVTQASLTATSRCRLYELSVLRRARLRVTLDLVQGEADLYVFDVDGRPLALCERTKGSEAASVQVGPGAPARVVVVAHGAARVRLSVTERKVRSPLETFMQSLARTPDQAKAVRALNRNPDFVRIRSYLETYPGGVPLQLRVVPGLMAHGVERFGTYSQGTLTINPTIAGHRQNPQELIDTLLHELVHAILALPRVDGFPLAGDVLDSSHDPILKGAVGSPLRRGRLPQVQAKHLDAHYGPSASNPLEDYTDINAGAQRLIIKVVRDNLRRSRVGKPTLVFRNQADRLKKKASAAK